MDIGEITLILSFATPIIVIILIFWWIKRDFSRLSKWAKQNKIDQANAKHAKAKIISSSQGLQGGDISRLIFLTFEVNNGYSEPYTASSGWFVDTLHFGKIQEGNIIDVKVDRNDPKKIYPSESWATYTEGYNRNFSTEKLRAK
jgi:hypothetical protein